MSEDNSTLVDHDELEAEVVPSVININADGYTVEYRLYTRRFYIAAVFSVFAMSQGAIWNTWGPVSDTAAKLYGWDNLQLAMLPNWGPIMFLFSFLPTIKILLHFGLRISVFHCLLLLVIGSGLRCIPANNLWVTILANVCAAFCGYTGALAMIAPTAITATWFPPEERTTATAVMTLSSNNIAIGVSFLAAKFLVPDYNLTDSDNSTAYLSTMRNDMERFMLIEFGVVAFVFIAVLLYFPKKPPSPPSSSASLPRVAFKEGAREVCKQGGFWLILTSYAISSGAMNAFVSVLDENLKNYDVSQDESNWLGFYSSLVGIPAGMIFSFVADYKKHWMKHVLIIAVLCAGLAYLWLTLSYFGILPVNGPSLYAAVLLGGFFGNGSIPLFYELICEVSYPVSEVVVTGLMTASSNLISGVFLVAVMLKKVGTVWVNPVVSGSFIICVPLLFFLKEEYKRLNADLEKRRLSETFTNSEEN